MSEFEKFSMLKQTNTTTDSKTIVNDQGLEKWLNDYNSIVDTYHSLKWNEVGTINDLLKDLSVVLSYLEFLRNNYHNKWIGVSMQEPGVSAGEREANHQVPELYQLRRVMTAGYRILDSMRSNISTANKERA